MTKPFYQCGNCKQCGSRWHLTDYCPFKETREIIQITQDGEALASYPQWNLHDDTLIGGCMATHYVCMGFVDLKEVSQNLNAIVCRACSLRVTIPNTIETFGELKAHFITTLQ